jgi:hypothetical protein
MELLSSAMDDVKKTNVHRCKEDKCPQMRSVCCNHNHVLSSFMTYHRVCNTTGATSGTGAVYHSVAPVFTSGISGVRSVLLNLQFSM